MIDGEHHPTVVADALRELESDYALAAVAFCGGSEKVGAAVLADPRAYYGHELIVGSGPADSLATAIEAQAADVVIDLADEPLVTATLKQQLAAQSEAAGLRYLAPGMGLAAAPVEQIAFSGPQLAVIGTGKRTGKTAVCGQLARQIAEAGGAPAVVSMGRGGPVEPILELPPVSLETLVALSRSGVHAASDYLEDAVIAGVPTVGCRRIGGGPSGETAFTNFAQGARLAATLPGVDTLLYEGSGAVVPPARADRTICIVGPGDQATALGGPQRIALGDLVLAPSRDARAVAAARLHARARVIEFAMTPEPIEPVPEGAIVAVFTTGAPAPPSVDARFVFDSLARRDQLERDLTTAFSAGCDHVLTELKAAAIDTVAERAIEAGVDVGFIRNRPHSSGADVGVELDEILLNVWREVSA